MQNKHYKGCTRIIIINRTGVRNNSAVSVSLPELIVNKFVSKKINCTYYRDV